MKNYFNWNKLSYVNNTYRQYTLTPDPEILSLFYNFETDVTDEVGLVYPHPQKAI